MRAMKRFLLASLLLFSLPTFAQMFHCPECTGTLHGSVRDVSGKSIPNLYLELWKLGALIEGIVPHTLTDAEGNYRFDHLEPGTYTVYPTDVKTGYDFLAPNFFAFVSGHPFPRARITITRPEAAIDLALPDKPAILEVAAAPTDKSKPIESYTVKLKTNRHFRDSEVTFSRGSREHEHYSIPIPPDTPIEIEINARGFRKWRSSGTYPPGAHSVIEARLVSK